MPRRVRVRATAEAAEDDPLKGLEVGQQFVGKVSKVWTMMGAIVDIGVGKEGRLEIGEYRDGFQDTNDLRKGDEVNVRVLRVHDGKLFLTRRTGDLARPPPRLQQGKTDLSAVPDISPDVWLEGEIEGFSTWSLWVLVTPPGGSEPVVGMLHKSEFRDGFADSPAEAIVGGKVRVRVLEINRQDNKMKMTMKKP